MKRFLKKMSRFRVLVRSSYMTTHFNFTPAFFVYRNYKLGYGYVLCFEFCFLLSAVGVGFGFKKY